MASTTLDARAVAGPGARSGAVPRRRLPAAVLAAAVIAVVEAIAVVAAALTSLDGLLTAPSRPSGAVVALVLLGLAAWAVFGAGGGLVLADGSGARLLVVVSVAETGALAVVLLLGLTTSAVDGLAPGLPVPALALSAVAVPVGKLLLATAPSTAAWLKAGPRPRVRAPQLSEGQRALRAATVTVIGLALLSVTLLDPGDGAADVPSPASTAQR
ncbi:MULTISPECIES: hypothetical protein [unclassified Blastococcus]